MRVPAPETGDVTAFSRLTEPRSSRVTVWCVAVLAVAYATYVGLLLSCDLLQVPPLGFIPHFDDRGMIATGVIAGSRAARGGLRTDHRIVRANGQAIEGRGDWQRAGVHIDPSQPLELVVEGAGVMSTVSVPLRGSN